LNSTEQPKAIIQTKPVELLPSQQVTELHAFLEGEGDQSLAYRRSVHFPMLQSAA